MQDLIQNWLSNVKDVGNCTSSSSKPTLQDFDLCVGGGRGHRTPLNSPEQDLQTTSNRRAVRTRTSNTRRVATLSLSPAYLQALQQHFPGQECVPRTPGWHAHSGFFTFDCLAVVLLLFFRSNSMRVMINIDI